MAESKSIGGHSAACCSIPPVVASGYAAKGTYTDVEGRKTYVTGPSDATRAILYLMDIFGFKDQTLQGADILATSDSQRQYRVFVPNWYEKGEPADITWFPPDNKDKEAKLGGFFERNAPPAVAKTVPGLVEALKKANPQVQTWAVIGFCAGAKVVKLSLASSPNLFSAAAACHPAMVDPADAPAITTPFALLASKDEPADKVAEFVQQLSGPRVTETYGDQIHGWMAARADLEDARVRKEYERGYCSVLEWFAKHVK